MNKERLAYLFNRYTTKQASLQEEEEFTREAVKPENKEILEDLIYELVKQAPGSVMSDDSVAGILQIIFKVIPVDNVVPVRKIGWKRIAVAASVIFLVGISAWWLTTRNTAPKVPPSSLAAQDVVAPQTNRATVTTADGKTIYLDSVNNGTLATQNNVELIKTADGQISYELKADSKRPEVISYHTLNNPRGSKIVDITLSDGSHIWLNAGSSLTYPVAFVGKERKVSMTGEAYFEVKHDATKKFIVEANGTTTEVFGTHFNVNAYSDEDAVRVTLLEGSVKVSAVNSQQSLVIKPGEQAVLTNDSRLSSHGDVNLGKIMAWKNNEFYFEDDNLEDILEQLSCWYDIHPVFTEAVSTYTTNYTGRINRTVPISEVLAMFEKIGYVKFEINGKEVKVIPVK